jgi:hypothetical protein
MPLGDTRLQMKKCHHLNNHLYYIIYAIQYNTAPTKIPFTGIDMTKRGERVKSSIAHLSALIIADNRIYTFGWSTPQGGINPLPYIVPPSPGHCVPRTS